MSSQGYYIKDVAKVVNGSFLNSGKNLRIKRLIYDSRKLIEPENALFFAIKGKRHDGHLFLKELYQKGVRNFIVTEEPDALADLGEANIIRVKDSILAMQRLAAHHRKQFDLPVIGITGSNGKTIVKEWLYQLLDGDYHIVRSPKSFNSQIGVPLSAWQINEHHTLGIFEAGISQPGEMEKLQKVLQPEIGIFTNIGEAHSEGFLNVKHKVKEKLILFINSDILIYCKDYHEINRSISEIKTQFLEDKEQAEKFNLFTWSMKTDADLRITKIKKRKNETDIYALYEETVHKITIPFFDDASIENAINCWATLLYLKVETSVIEERMARLGRISMRLELREGINNCSIINDSYNSDVRSLSIALDFLNQQHQHEKRTLILSDILQSGKDDQQLYSEVRDLIVRNKVNRLIGIGKSITNQRKFFKSNSNGIQSDFYETTDAFLKEFPKLHFDGETILLKGARKFEFEKISKLLEQKVHKTVLEINLNALVHNLQIYHSRLKPGTKIMAMVKAFSYGSGSFEIANVLQYQLVDYLAVAYADEGVHLRKGGITLPIMVMNPELKSFETMIKHNLEPEIYSLSILKKFKEAMVIHYQGNEPYPVHIKIDSGMHRLGFTEAEIPALKKVLEKMPHIKIQSVFSHLSASEAGEHDDFTKRQIKTFEKASGALTKGLSYPVIRHILNSAGILRFPDAQYDMVRLGIGLYGVDTSGMVSEQLEQVSTLKSTISQIKTVKKGEAIGYNLSHIAQEDMKIAVVGIGYADGIDRRLGKGNGQMLVKGKPAPIVGNVCMDMTMIDITGISNVSEGDEVIVFGKELPIQKIAEKMGTIPYEVLTGISGRVKRVYFQE